MRTLREGFIMCLFPKSIVTRPIGRVGERVTVSCGRCLECVRQRSYEWAFRIMHECSLHSENCFLTLTYNDEHLPVDHSVSRREIQLFMKRLRKALFPRKVRFFACGEYGKKLHRPHYHLIIFGWFPSDSWFFKKDGGVDLFRSPLLEKVWSFGFSSVGRVSLESALYCAKYMNKFAYERAGGYFSDMMEFPFRLLPPFVQMSNRPGIGADCAYKVDLLSDRIYMNGRSCKIPRYYLKLLEREGVFLDDFRERRKKQGEMVERVTDLEKKRKRITEFFLERLHVVQ